MLQIAQTFEAAGLPGGLHEAAAGVFDRLAIFKDAAAPVSSADLTNALLAPG